MTRPTQDQFNVSTAALMWRRLSVLGLVKPIDELPDTTQCLDKIAVCQEHGLVPDTDEVVGLVGRMVGAFRPDDDEGECRLQALLLIQQIPT